MLFKAGNRVLRYGSFLGFALKDLFLFGNLTGTNKWAGGVLAPNGKIYGIPWSSTQVLEIDPETQTTQLFGNLTGTNKWYGGVLAPNGKIYGIPRGSTQVLEIDPETQTTQLFGNLTGTNKWGGGVLAPNGKIYGIPVGSTQIFEFNTRQSPATADIAIPQDLANLAASNYNKYYNKL